jgi:hypothetical protein
MKNQLGSAKICFEGGRGYSIDDAVIIRGIQDTAVGIQAEKLFISNKFGQEDHDWYFLEQVLIVNDKAYDVITIKLSDSTFEKIYFDISEFYGRHKNIAEELK